MKRKHWFIRIFSFFAIFSFLLNCVCYGTAVREDSKVSLEEVLDSFGFTAEGQKDAFKFICEKAGVPLPERLGAHELLQLVVSTQERFVNRADKQERWETKDLNWMAQNVEDLNKKFVDLGIVDATLYGFKQYTQPNCMQYDAVCILGARKSEMEKRIKFVERVVKDRRYSFNWLVLLTGARPATIGVDGTMEEIAEIAQFFGIESGEVTEAHIFKYLYEKSSLNNGEFKFLMIDTPAKDGRRPTTQTTVEDFCLWINAHPGKIDQALFISSQPYVDYQMAIIEEILQQKDSNLKFKVAGDLYVPGNNSVKTLAGALGSYIWAGMPNCLRRFGFKIKNDEELALAKRLYSHMPWIYKSLPFVQVSAEVPDRA